MGHDLVIRNGTVVDGTGAPPRRADVGIAGGKIVEIGDVDVAARRVIDADGHIVTPGFIDGHTHMDAQVFWDPHGSPSCYHGVTTAVMGHCGFSLAPAPKERAGLVVRNLERAEDISAAAMAQGIDWTWTTFGEYLEALDRAPKGINYAANIGHSALRTFVMGERAFEESASEHDVSAMRQHLATSLRAGAWGFTTSRNDSHETSDDRPVASRLAAWSEVEQLVDVLATTGGVFQITPAMAVFGYEAGDAAAAAGPLREISDLATRFPQVPVLIPAISTAPHLLEFIDDVAARGGHVVGMSHSRGITVLLSFETQLPFDKLPEWRELRALPLAEQGRLLRDPSVRERLVRSAVTNPFGRAIGTEARPPDYEHIRVLADPVEEGPTIAELAASRRRDPVEVMIDLALAQDLKQFFTQRRPGNTRANLLATMTHPRTVMTFSDAGAHVSQIADCSIHTHLLAHWVRAAHAFPIHEAIRMITSVPAGVWGFHDRGRLQPGFAADVNVIDPDTVAPDLPELVTDLPGGARRIMQTARGFRATVVGGEIVLEDGQPTGAYPGRVLRSGAADNT